MLPELQPGDHFFLVDFPSSQKSVALPLQCQPRAYLAGLQARVLVLLIASDEPGEQALKMLADDLYVCTDTNALLTQLRQA